MQGSYRGIIHGSPKWSELPLPRSIICGVPGVVLKHILLKVFDYAFHVHGKAYSFEDVNMRFLAFESLDSGAYEILPSSCFLLWNLQSLIIELPRNAKVIVMPDEFWKMRQLRHVKCKKIYLPNPNPCNDQVLMLDKLQTLKVASNLKLSEEVCNIICNSKKLHLRYRSSSLGYDESFCKFVCNTDRLHKLESLDIKFETDLTEETIRLVYEFSFPSSLKKLSLRGSRLSWEFMTEIGSLPHLEVLNLGTLSVMDKDECWRPVNGQFLRLKFLKIEYCLLTNWVADSCHFPVLEKLVLIGLDDLREIPSGIGDIGTLQLIQVERCSEDAAISAIRIKDDADAEDGLQIQVVVGDSKLESFMERLLREELAIENFQFKE